MSHSPLWQRSGEAAQITNSFIYIKGMKNKYKSSCNMHCSVCKMVCSMSFATPQRLDHTVLSIEGVIYAIIMCQSPFWQHSTRSNAEWICQHHSHSSNINYIAGYQQKKNNNKLKTCLSIKKIEAKSPLNTSLTENGRWKQQVNLSQYLTRCVLKIFTPGQTHARMLERLEQKSS